MLTKRLDKKNWKNQNFFIKVFVKMSNLSNNYDLNDKINQNNFWSKKTWLIELNTFLCSLKNEII